MEVKLNIEIEGKTLSDVKGAVRFALNHGYLEEFASVDTQEEVSKGLREFIGDKDYD